jgi:hypothetical protein
MAGKLELGASMASAKEFRERAAECRRMAEGAGNGMMRGVWARLAERWLTCAALAEPKLSESDQAQLSH